ncbi:MAG: acyltransferase [Rhodoferax sp.]|nr:acyltransferase [Rhodoferax sp.]
MNLFFIISGFVIFMTLLRTTRPLDFVVSRFSRLFPAYWVSIALTLAITHALGLPDKLVSAGTALANVFMLHGLAGVAHVDGVYWTLEVELLFYFGMFALYRLRLLEQIHLMLALLVGLRLLYFATAQFAGIDLSWTVSRLLILQYIPWFSIGVAIYLHMAPRNETDKRQSIWLAGFAAFALTVADSMTEGLLAGVLATAVYLAASGRAGVLKHPALVWLGSISYPLYLLHENIGWSILLRALAAGVPFDAAVALTLAASLTLAALVSRTVEQPVMRWIRDRYRARQLA